MVSVNCPQKEHEEEMNNCNYISIFLLQKFCEIAGFEAILT